MTRAAIAAIGRQPLWAGDAFLQRIRFFCFRSADSIDCNCWFADHFARLLKMQSQGSLILKRLLPAAAALALAATSVLAADLPHYKAPYLPPPPPPPMWTGFYVGLNAGGAWSSSNSVTTSGFPLLNPPVGVNMPVPPGNSVSFNPGIPIGSMAALSASGVRSGSSNGGFIGGGQIGYNWQFYNSFVAGIEADIQGIASNSSAVTGFGAAANPIDSYSGFSPTITIPQIRRSVDYLGTVRGRLGWLFTPTLLVYGSGGLAYGGVHLSANFLTANLGPGFGAGFCASCVFGPSFGNGSYSDTRVGWTAGGGLEWMFWPNWSAKAEYLYYDLGHVSAPSSVLVGATSVGFVNYAYAVNVTTRFNGNIVRAGVNYHFNWGAPPVIAKY